MPVLAYEASTQQIHTPVFDGPLELLLYLVRRKGVDIRFVKIAPITDAFLTHLKQLQEMQLDIAGEFLLLASTLCYLKSCELLPGMEREEEESEEDPMTIRNRLAEQLREYERFRGLSALLEQCPTLGQNVFTRPQTHEPNRRSVHIDIDAYELLEIYQNILFKKPVVEPEHHITKEPFSLRKMGEWLLDQLDSGEQSLHRCLNHFQDKKEKIICFLTVLEMAKHHMVQIAQFEHLSEIHIYGQYTIRPSLETIFTEEEAE